MHIAILNPFDQLPWESERRGRYGMLSDELISRGHHVTWITADFRHATKSYRDFSDHQSNANIIPVHVSSYKKNISLRRIVSHNEYANRAYGVLDNITDIDIVIASIPPTRSARFTSQF